MAKKSRTAPGKAAEEVKEKKDINTEGTEIPIESPEDAAETAEAEPKEDIPLEGGPEEGGEEAPDPKDEKIAELNDKNLRLMAEFENFRKRTDKEKSQMFDMGAKSVIEKILPVIDNFERGLENIPEGCDPAFAEGMEKIYKQLAAELEKIGVKPIEAVGQPFDPNFHNAVMQTESEEFESGTVAAELQKGYTYRDTLVRPSMVSVVQ